MNADDPELIREIQHQLRSFYAVSGQPCGVRVSGELDAPTKAALVDACRSLGIEPRLTRETADRIAAAIPQRATGTTSNSEPMSWDEQERAAIAVLQRDLNAHLEREGAEERLAIDGHFGARTARVFADSCARLGLDARRDVHVYRRIGASLGEDAHADAASGRRRGKPAAASRSLPPARRRQAYIAALQRDLNVHLLRRGRSTLIPVDGAWGAMTQATFEEVCRELGIEPVQHPAIFRRIACALVRRPRRTTADTAARHTHATTDAGHKRDVAAAIEAHGGRYGQDIVRAARRTGVRVALLCALLQHESGFRNVFGHDPVANPIKSPPGGLLAVTRERYEEYRHHRAQGLGSQGVGPAQLTYKGYQDRADQLGGCWRPGVNIHVGAEALAANIRAHGNEWQALRAYNGTGPAAEAYANAVSALARHWTTLLAGAGAGGAPATVDRLLTLSSPNMHGPDVLAFQRLLNRRLTGWNVDSHVAEDGQYGPVTARSARLVARGMGIAKSRYAHGFSPEVRHVMRHPSARTAEEMRRARQRESWRARLRRRPPRASIATLLHGFPPPRSRKLIRLIPEAGTYGLVVTSTTGGVHAAHSYHYTGHAVDFSRSDWPTPAGRARLVRFQHHLLGRRAVIKELFGPDAAACVKDGQQISISGALAAQHENHVHVAI